MVRLKYSYSSIANYYRTVLCVLHPQQYALFQYLKSNMCFLRESLANETGCLLRL